MTLLSQALRTLLPAAALVTAVACGGSSTGGTGAPETGTPGGQCFPEGKRVPAADGCNTCTCSNGTYACTEKACPAADSGTCTPGSSQPAPDGCNTCSCSSSGQWMCTLIACNTCTPGQTKMDACNSCSCLNGQWACTDKACPPPACVDGQTKPQDCNTCTCMNGGWQCTNLYCPPPPVCNSGDTRYDGCNTCSCMNGSWACTARACPPPVDAGPALDGGPAPKFCGGFVGNTCASTEYCAYVEGQLCGAADAGATCKPRPNVCTKEYAPVCGCDQVTYGNACMAAAGGTGILHAGSCP